MPLSYLEQYHPHVNLEALLRIHEEKNKWKEQKLTTKYLPIIEQYKNINVEQGTTSTDRYAHAVNELSEEQQENITKIAHDLIPWRKGPFKINDLEIDSEWRSDLKWKRIQESLPDLKNKRILDIGCNNGYYMYQMQEQKPEMVLGIDPVVHNKIQFDFFNHFSNSKNLHFELFGIEEVKHFRSLFDVIFSMGIIYHHRHPIEQLMDIREALVSEGHMIIETIGIPGEESICLFPEDRYSKMRNVWFLPTLSCFKNWVARAGFTNIEVISVCETTTEEQRLTKWCPPPFQSLEEFLDPQDKSKTVEGYPAPIRFCIKAQKKVSPKKIF